MISFVRKLWHNKRGNAIMIAAACLPMIVACAGLASDTIQWTLWKRQLQRAADSGAIAGVYDRQAASGSTSTVPATVSHDLTLNDHTWMSLATGYPDIKYDANCPVTSTAAMSNRVCVTLGIRQALPFSSLFLSSGPLIVATATAATISTGTPCALALSGTGTAMDYSGNATVNAPTCILYSDSSSANSASAGGSSSVTAKSIAGVGGIAQSNNWHVQSYIPYSPSLPDPLSNVTPDTNDMKCAGHYEPGKKGGSTWVYDALDESTDMVNATYLDASGNVQKGANCWTSLSTSASNKGGLTVPGSYSGPIYIDANSGHGGTGSVDMQGKFNCDSCTVVMTNSNPTENTIGTWSANAQSQTNITSPTSGTFAGIAVYQDRRAAGGNIDKINGGSNNVLSGAVYFPKDTLQINGSGTSVSLCALWVANKITFLGNSSIALSSPDDTVCSGKEAGAGNPVQMVRLVG